MAARYFYVDSTHPSQNTTTSDTSFSSPQTGSIDSITSAQVYDSITRVTNVAPPPIDGDYILVVNDHDASVTENINIEGSTSHTGAGLALMSVDATSIDSYLPGAKETTTQTTYFRNNVLSAGIDYETPRTTRIGSAFSSITLQDCRLIATGDGDSCFYAPSPGRCKLYNVELETQHTGAYGIRSTSEGVIELYGCKSVSTAVSTKFIECTEGRVECHGCDFSDISGAIVYNFGVATQNEVFIGLYNCQVNASVSMPTITDEGAARHRFEMYGCDDSTSNLQHRFYVIDNAGLAYNLDNAFISNTESWFDGSTKSSIWVIPSTTCSLIIPFIFKLPTEYVDFTNDKILDFYISAVGTLYKEDFSIFMVYPDGTNVSYPNIASSSPATLWTPDPVEVLINNTQTALSTTSDVWNGVQSLQYKVTIDTTSNVGSPGIPDIYLHLYKAGILKSIRIDTEISAKS